MSEMNNGLNPEQPGEAQSGQQDYHNQQYQTGQQDYNNPQYQNDQSGYGTDTGYNSQQYNGSGQNNDFGSQQYNNYTQNTGYNNQQYNNYAQNNGYGTQQYDGYAQNNGYDNQQYGGYDQNNGYDSQQYGGYAQNSGYDNQQYNNYGQGNGYNNQPYNNYGPTGGYNNYGQGGGYNNQPYHNYGPGYNNPYGYNNQPYANPQGAYNRSMPAPEPVTNIFYYILMALTAAATIINIFAAKGLITNMFSAIDLETAAGTDFATMYSSMLYSFTNAPGYSAYATLNSLFRFAILAVSIIDIVQVHKKGYPILGLILFTIFCKPGYFIWRAYVLKQKKTVPVLFTVSYVLLYIIYFLWSFFYMISLMP